MKHTCPACGRPFTPWRSKKFCSEACRKRAENRRLRGDETAPATMVAEAENPENNSKQNQVVARALRGDDPSLEWRACNEVTRMLTPAGSKSTETRAGAVAWAIKVEGHGWFGRIGADFAFGPTTERRAKDAVEARLIGRPFQKVDDERTWAGTLWRLLCGSETSRVPILEQLDVAA